MAKTLATKELVFQSATELKSQGKDPTIIEVQAHIGGGSYTTIKRYLDEWRKTDFSNSLPHTLIPESLKDKHNAFLSQIWIEAVKVASHESLREKEQLTSQREAAIRDQKTAEMEIARLESIELSQQDSINALQNDLTDARRLTSELTDLVNSIEPLQQSLEQAKTELENQLDKYRSLEKDHLRLEGELTSLTKQVSGLTALLAPTQEP